MTRISSRLILAIAGTLAIAGCGGDGAPGASADTLPKVSAPAGKSWSEAVVATDDGMLMGNPDAAIRLVEYASPTCSHCAEFSRASAPELKSQFIDSGRVSLELRPFMLNPMDLAIAGIVSCAGPDRFFPLLDNVFASQEALFTGFQGADQQAAQATLSAQDFAAFARVLGLDNFFAARGMATADIDRCLADKDNVLRWQQSTERNQRQHEITGTPAFLINDQLITDANSWPAVKERLEAAGAR